MGNGGVIILVPPWDRQVKRREPGGRPEFHLPAGPIAVPDLHVHPQQLPCFFLAVADVSPRCIVDPDGMGVIKFSNQQAAFKIRYSGNITGIPVTFEPGCVVLG